jgi:hypothetical protein
MTDAKTLLDRYLLAWTEPETNRRHDVAAELYAADTYYANQGADYRGLDGAVTAITRNYDKFISQGFTFEAAGDVVEHHNSARIPWRMMAPDGTTVAAAGMQFLILDDSGLVTSDYQFITQAPPAA